MDMISKIMEGMKPSKCLCQQLFADKMLCDARGILCEPCWMALFHAENCEECHMDKTYD